MSTWTSESPRRRRAVRPVLALAAGGLLGGCIEGGITAGSLGFAASGTRAAPPVRATPLGRPLKTVALVGGRVVVSGPDGYCIDGDSVTTGGEQGFAVVASCEVLSGGAIGKPVEPVILSVTVLPPGEGGTLVPSAAALAAAQAPARVLERVEARGLTLVHLASGGDAATGSGDARHWRGAMSVNGHLVMMALYVSEGSPLAGSAGQVLLRQMARRLDSASPAAGSAALPQAPAGAGKDVAE